MKKFVLLIPILLLSLSIYVNAADCGGAVRCYCGDTVTSNHTMTYDIPNCARNGPDAALKVNSAVTLNCQGHTISGTGHGFGVRFEGGSSQVVRNCVVFNFDNGIRNDAATNAQVLDSVFSYNTQTSVTFGGATGGTVRNNLIYDNGYSGINIYSMSGVSVYNNEFAHNTEYGIYVDGASGNTFYNNTLYDNQLGNAIERTSGSSNNWNTSTLGNDWSDFGSNPGYPNTYIIPGPGPGVDRRPRSALAIIDLAIYSNQITIPQDITEGDRVPIRFYVHNNGYAAASNVRINVLMDDNVIFPISNQYIGAHANISISVYWSATAGGHTLGIQVDPYNVIPETNEGNNAGGRSFYVESIRYAFVWIPFGGSREWTDQSFSNAVDTRANFFNKVTPLRNCENFAVHIKIPVHEVEEHCPVLTNFWIGLSGYIADRIKDCAENLTAAGLIPPIRTKVVGLSNGHHLVAGVGGSRIGFSYVYAEANNRLGDALYDTPSHELGHAYGLCDEYHYYSDIIRGIIGYYDQNLFWGCPNPWSATWDEPWSGNLTRNHPCLTNQAPQPVGQCKGADGWCCGATSYSNFTDTFPAGPHYPTCHITDRILYNIMGSSAVSETTCGFSFESYEFLQSDISCAAGLKSLQNRSIVKVGLTFNISDVGSDSVTIESLNEFISDKEISDLTSFSDYHLDIFDENNTLLLSKVLPVYYVTLTSPENVNDSNADVSNFTSVVTEYVKDRDWHTLRVYRNDTLLLEENIGELLCNNNQMCDNFENYYSCEADCPNSGPDNTCQSEENGICDPDCAEGIDIDCGCRVPTDGLVLRYNTILCDGTYNLENGIFIDSNNISITCNNCTLIGNKTSFGISLIQRNNVEISNLKIVNFSTGVYLQNSTQNTIRNVRVQGHTTGINLLYSNSNEIHDNFLTSNTNSTLLIDSSSNNIHGNVIQNSNFKGALLVRSQNNLFYRNVLNNNNQSAYEDNLSIGNAWNNSITGNNWSDFTANPGYPNFYEIYGPGDGIDYLPNGRIYNTAPRFTPFNNITIREANRVLLDLNATDAENNILTFYTNASAVLPSEFTFNSTTGLFDWTPTYLDQGNYTIFLNVTDGAQWDYAKLFITVLDVRVGGGSPIFLKPIKKIIDREIP